MKYIYLDQNKWILLANGYYRREQEILNIVKLLKEKVKKREIIIPLSISHVSETMRREDEQSREKLWEFMTELSSNNTICPFSKYLTEIESRNVFRRRMGLPESRIKNLIFRRGVSGLFGMKAELKNTENIPKNKVDEMLAKVDSFETLKMIYSLPGAVKAAKESSRICEEETRKLDLFRKKERAEFKDKNLGNIVIKARYFASEVFPILAEVNKDYRLPVHAILKDGATKKDAEALLQEFPSTYSYFCLTDRRDRELKRKISSHDLNDIFALSVAIPYCDIVFAEKMFISIAKSAKLDKIYNSKLTYSFNEFKSLLS